MDVMRLTDLARAASPTWQDRAACKGSAAGLFYATDDEDGIGEGSRLTVQAAKAVCATCPVVDECLDYAIRARELFGVWGGQSPAERRRSARKMGVTIRPVKDRSDPAIRCGTYSGYQSHKRRREEPCWACNDAHNSYQRMYRKGRS